MCVVGKESKKRKGEKERRTKVKAKEAQEERVSQGMLIDFDVLGDEP